MPGRESGNAHEEGVVGIHLPSSLSHPNLDWAEAPGGACFTLHFLTGASSRFNAKVCFTFFLRMMAHINPHLGAHLSSGCGTLYRSVCPRR
jgi:hypothetical protein